MVERLVNARILRVKGHPNLDFVFKASAKRLPAYFGLFTFAYPISTSIAGTQLSVIHAFVTPGVVATTQMSS